MRRLKRGQRQQLANPNLKDCKNIAYRYISKYLCSAKRLQDYLERKGCSEYSAMIVNDFINMGLLNDRDYAVQLVNEYAGKYSSRVIMTKLLCKGIPRGIAEEVILKLEDMHEKNAAIRALRAALKTQMRKTSDPVKLSMRLKASLFRKGFSPAVVSHALKVIQEETGIVIN